MAGTPILHALDATIQARGGYEWVLSQFRDGIPIKDMVLDLGCSRTLFDRWRSKLSHDQQLEIRRARGNAAVEQAQDLLDSADSPSDMSIKREQARFRQWLASRVDRESWGEDKPQAVTLNVHTLHLAALQAQKPPITSLPVTEVHELSAGDTET